MEFRTYWVTFEIKDATTPKGTYNDRYEALMDGLNKISNGWWAQPTSFVVFGTSSPRAAVVQTIKAAIDTSADIVVLGASDYKVFDCIGAVRDLEALQSMVSFAKKA